MVRHDTRYVAVKFSCLPASQQVVKAVTHFRYENGHSWTFIAVVQAKLHLIALGIKCCDVIIEFVTRNEKSVKFPLYAHEKHSFYLVYILIKVNDVSFIIRNKLSYLRDDTLLVRAV